MNLDQIITGDWVCLKNNPQVKFKVLILNPNGMIVYRSKENNEYLSVHTSEVELLDDTESLSEIAEDGEVFLL